MNKKNEMSQKDKFIETVSALGCDELKEAFAKKLKGIASVKPKAEPKKKVKNK